MITKRFLLIISVLLATASCDKIDDTTTDGKVKKAFTDWSKNNLPTKINVESVSYDTVGCPMDYMYNATVLGQTVGGSGHTESEINIGIGLISSDCNLDSSLLTTDIIISKINCHIKDSICTYYIGMRGDSICTSPQEHIYEALIKTHKEGEQRIYDACYEIFCNLNDFVAIIKGGEISSTKKDYYEFWVYLPSYEEAMEQTTYNSILNSKL